MLNLFQASSRAFARSILQKILPGLAMATGNQSLNDFLQKCCEHFKDTSSSNKMTIVTGNESCGSQFCLSQHIH
jgi:hypothetical protein